MRKKIDNPHIVEEYKVGNTLIRIASNCYEGKTHEDGEKVMEKIVQIALREWAAAEQNI